MENQLKPARKSIENAGACMVYGGSLLAGELFKKVTFELEVLWNSGEFRR
jgi:hypothetical protein